MPPTPHPPPQLFFSFSCLSLKILSSWWLNLHNYFCCPNPIWRYPSQSPASSENFPYCLVYEHDTPSVLPLHPSVIIRQGWDRAQCHLFLQTLALHLAVKPNHQATQQTPTITSLCLEHPCNQAWLCRPVAPAT